jgi:predicted N-acyltransferase
MLHNSSPYLTKEFFYQLNNNMPNKLVFIFAEKEGRRIASALNVISETEPIWSILGRTRIYS